MLEAVGQRALHHVTDRVAEVRHVVVRRVGDHFLEEVQDRFEQG